MLVAPPTNARDSTRFDLFDQGTNCDPIINLYLRTFMLAIKLYLVFYVVMKGTHIMKLLSFV